MYLRGCFSDCMSIMEYCMLGPILFLVYINDLPDLVLSNLYMFTDDTKLYCAIKSKGDCTCDILQTYS